jgi:hypothetical protein
MSDDVRGMTHERLEESSLEGNTNLPSRAAARVELRRRDGEAAEQREQSRRDFETALADKQLRAATDVAWATKLAMWAAAAASLGAIIQAAMAVASYLK